MFHHLSMGHGLELPEDFQEHLNTQLLIYVLTPVYTPLSLYVNLGLGQKVMKIDVWDSSPGTC